MKSLTSQLKLTYEYILDLLSKHKIVFIDREDISKKLNISKYTLDKYIITLTDEEFTKQYNLKTIYFTYKGNLLLVSLEPIPEGDYLVYIL